MGVPGQSIGRGLRGRANRKEYWLYVVALVAVSMAAPYLPPIANLAGVGVLSYIQIRRLHDIGRTGWWVAGYLALQVVVTLVAFAYFGEEEPSLIVGTIFVFIPIIALGVLPGETLENRFGPPPGVKPLKDVFN